MLGRLWTRSGRLEIDGVGTDFVAIFVLLRSLFSEFFALDWKVIVIAD